MNTTVYKDGITGDSYLFARHSSGLEVYLMPRKEYSSSYAIFGTRYGSVNIGFKAQNGQDVTVPAGIAHFLEHKLFESEDGDAFARFSKTGANANAYTSFDRTCYLFSCSNCFEDNLNILLDFVQSPYFTKETVDKEQGIIGQEIKMYDDSAPWCVMFNMLGAMYKSHPVRIDIAGTVDSIAQIDKDLLYTCYNTFYNPANMFICIAGNFDADTALSLIDKGLKDKPAVPVSHPSYYEEPKIVKPYVEQKLAVSMPMFCFGYKEDCRGMRTLKERISTGILLDILCCDTSPVYEQMINDGLINDSFESEYFCGRDFAVPMFEGESKNPKEVANRIKCEVERLKKEGISKEEFDITVKNAWGNAVTRTQGNSNAVSAMVECAMFGDKLFDELEILKSITLDDVYEALARFDNGNCVLSVILPA